MQSLVAALALFGCLAIGCAAPPPPAAAPAPAPAPARDLDGTPREATALGLGTRHADALDRSRGDLDDWFRIEVPRAGTLTLIVEGPSRAPLPNLTVALADATGATLATPARSGGRPRVGFGPRSVQRGAYLIWIGSEPSASGPVPYELRTSFAPQVAQAPKPAPPPKPPAPRFETKRLRLVELSAGGQTATISGGRADGVAVGVVGRLLEKGAPIAQLRVVEVYERGSRVRVDPPVTKAPSPTMSVEVDVPLP